MSQNISVEYSCTCDSCGHHAVVNTDSLDDGDTVDHPDLPDNWYWSPSGNELLCDHCYDEQYFGCAHCGNTFSTDERNYVEDDGIDVCDHCYDEHYSDDEGLGTTSRSRDPIPHVMGKISCSKPVVPPAIPVLERTYYGEQYSLDFPRDIPTHQLSSAILDYFGGGHGIHTIFVVSKYGIRIISHISSPEKEYWIPEGHIYDAIYKLIKEKYANQTSEPTF